MKRRDLLQLLEEHGCLFLRHGARHDIYMNPTSGKTQAIPRHKEIKESVVRNILLELSIVQKGNK